MPFETLTLQPATREDWLALRKTVVGASEIAAVLGASPYTTPLELWSHKTGRLETAETAAMRRGSRLEKVALDILAEERPDWTITSNAIPGGKVYVNRSRRISCTPDAFAIDPTREGTGIVQVKSVHPGAFAKWQDELPLHIALQVVQEATLTGASWAVVAALVVDRGIDLHVLDVPLDVPDLVAVMQAKVADFWRYVETDTPPPLTPGKDLATVKALALAAPSQADPEEVSLDGDNALLDALVTYYDLAAQLAEHRADQKIMQARQAVAEEVIRSKMGAQKFARAGDFAILQKLVERRAYTVKASSSLKLTVTRRNAIEEAA
jgi:putative phage-type endonuclease